MRAIFAALFLITMAANQTLGQDGIKRSLPIKGDFSFLEDYWGMRVKSYAVELVQVKTKTGDPLTIGRITYMLQFEKDIINQDLETLQAIFVDKNRRLRHVFFDQDNIAINPFLVLPYRIQGEISGVKGEAIRMYIDIESDAELILQNAKKLVVRP